MKSTVINGQLVDIIDREIYPAQVILKDGIIHSIQKTDSAPAHYIMPGFIDAHIHIESSMLVPSEFARIAVLHGTVATVSDPHEIANVLGIPGVQYMIDNGKQVPFKFNFGAPSCVPATSFETAGATINSEGIKTLMQSEDIKYLAEMMNYPGVLIRDPEVMKKIAIAQSYNKPIDGHAPGLRGEDAQQYINCGISTDHECYTEAEAVDKLAKGMKIILREGSAAKNFNALIGLLATYYNRMMFCSDDKHPDDLIEGHINQLCARAVEKGNDLFKVLQVACINPIEHYNLAVGQLKEGDSADLIVVQDLKKFKVLETYIDGQLVAKNNQSMIESVPLEQPNNFNTSFKNSTDFNYPARDGTIPVIAVHDGELITSVQYQRPAIKASSFISDTQKDLLKIAVVNRYSDAPVSVAFIKNFGLKAGAIASSVAHDSHNIIVVGVDDTDIVAAVNCLIKTKGGICAVHNQKRKALPLPIAGLMSDLDGWTVGKHYQEIDSMAKELGSTLTAPFMSLSFMALLVIPDLKLSDKGLFSGKEFKFIP